MATVWRAWAHGANGFRKRVAIKRIVERYRRAPDVLQMFVEEARVGAALQHPNIVGIFDFGSDERGDHFLVSEYVDGPHLGTYVKSFGRGAAPWAMVTAIAVEVLRALEAAHSRVREEGTPAPVLHRDVSPPNILIDRMGVVKLADFGMARAMDRGRITQPDIVKGKLSYLAPELVLGHPPTAQSDLFALGIVMWEALTGERLFDADTDIEVIHRLRDARAPLLAMHRPSLPLGLTTVVHRALEREPERRFASARDMRLALIGELRVLPVATDAEALASSVRDADRRGQNQRA